jgi:hypothetical protein
VRVEVPFVVDAAEAASVAAVAELGVLSTGQRGVQAELEKDELVRLLPDWEMGSSGISAILSAGRTATSWAHALVNYTFEEIREIEACSPHTLAWRSISLVVVAQSRRSLCGVLDQHLSNDSSQSRFITREFADI